MIVLGLEAVMNEYRISSDRQQRYCECNNVVIAKEVSDMSSIYVCDLCKTYSTLFFATKRSNPDDEWWLFAEFIQLDNNGRRII